MEPNSPEIIEPMPEIVETMSFDERMGVLAKLAQKLGHEIDEEKFKGTLQLQIKTIKDGGNARRYGGG